MKISVITATYNSAATLRNTMESILRQGYTDYEYIVVDGASKDATVDIIREYEPRFEGRMRWVSEPDKGIYDAMNKGIAMATGDAVGFPIGVNKCNVLTVNSTPRSKRLAEVLQKTGLVEKSGQGVDKMFTNCIMEAKPLPDYSETDNYQVDLKFRTEIKDIPFLVYIRKEQAKRPKHHKLNVFQLMAIYNVCFD